MAKRIDPSKQRVFDNAWSETQKRMKSDFMSLKANGESIDVIFVASPFTRREMNKAGVEQTRAYFPVFNSVGLQAWGVGKRVCNDIHTLWSDSTNRVFTITRVGEPGNTETKYTVESAATQNKQLVEDSLTVTTRELVGLQSRICTSKEVADDAEAC